MWAILGIVLFVGFVALTGAPYLPSKFSDIQRAFRELYRLDENDVLVDIGSGDGIVLREASRLGAQAIGYEIHPLLVIVSRWLSRHDPRVTVQLANLWQKPLPDDVTVVYAFGDKRDIGRMLGRVQDEATRLGREIAFISYGFEIADRRPIKSVGAHHLYVVAPAL